MISIEGTKPKKLAYKSSKTFHRGVQQDEGWCCGGRSGQGGSSSSVAWLKAHGIEL